MQEALRHRWRGRRTLDEPIGSLDFRRSQASYVSRDSHLGGSIDLLKRPHLSACSLVSVAPPLDLLSADLDLKPPAQVEIQPPSTPSLSLPGLTNPTLLAGARLEDLWVQCLGHVQVALAGQPRFVLIVRAGVLVGKLGENYSTGG